MRDLTYSERIQYVSSILSDDDFIHWVMSDWPDSLKTNYQQLIINPARLKLNGYDPRDHSEDSNLALINELHQMAMNHQQSLNREHQSTRIFDKLFWPIDWRPDHSIINTYNNQRRFQKRHLLSTFFRQHPALSIDLPFNAYLSRLLPDNIITFSGVLNHEQFNQAANYVDRYPHFSLSEQQAKDRTDPEIIRQVKDTYKILKDFINEHLFQDGLIEEYLSDPWRFSKLFDPTEFTVMTQTDSGTWYILLDEQAREITQLILSNMMREPFFTTTFIDTPIDRIIELLVALERCRSTRGLLGNRRIEGLYFMNNWDHLGSCIDQLIDRITTPDIIKKLTHYSNPDVHYQENQIVQRIRTAAEKKKSISELKMATTVMLQGRHQSSSSFFEFPKDLIRHIGNLSRADNLDTSTTTQAIREAEEYHYRPKASHEGIPSTDLQWMIEGFKEYNSRIDKGMKPGHPESKFRNFKFPFGINSEMTPMSRPPIF